MRQFIFTAVDYKRRIVDIHPHSIKIKRMMEEIELELLKQIPASANYRDACERLLQLLLKASGADFMNPLLAI